MLSCSRCGLLRQNIIDNPFKRYQARLQAGDFATEIMRVKLKTSRSCFFALSVVFETFPVLIFYGNRRTVSA